MESEVAANYEALNFWLHVVEMLGIVLLGVMQWLGNRQRATKESINRVESAAQVLVKGLSDTVNGEFKSFDARLDEHNDRLIVLEQNMPTDDKWKTLYERLGMLEQGVSGLRSEQKATDRLVHTIDNFLRNKDK